MGILEVYRCAASDCPLALRMQRPGVHTNRKSCMKDRASHHQALSALPPLAMFVPRPPSPTRFSTIVMSPLPLGAHMLHLEPDIREHKPSYRSRIEKSCSCSERGCKLRATVLDSLRTCVLRLRSTWQQAAQAVLTSVPG